MNIITSKWSRNTKSQLFSAFSQSHAGAMNHCRPHGPTIYIGIVSSKYMILSKRVHTDVPAIGMVIVDAPSPVVLQAFVSRWHQAASVCRLAGWTEDDSSSACSNRVVSAWLCFWNHHRYTGNLLLARHWLRACDFEKIGARWPERIPYPFFPSISTWRKPHARRAGSHETSLFF